MVSDLDYQTRLSTISWPNFQTAYGSAETTSRGLWNLRFAPTEIAKIAAHDLWCGLCHQHVYISPAAWPAVPFLFNALHAREDIIKIEILDIFLGFTKCLSQKSVQNRSHWENDLAKMIMREVDGFKTFCASENSDISDFAYDICEYLNIIATPK